MSKQVRFRRGTTAQHSTFTGAEAEITVDTTKSQVVVHDGATAGGVPLLREDRPRGYTKMEFITSTPYTWTQTGKTDLKRIRVTAYGGGAGGQSGTGGGGSGGIGFVTLEASAVTTNVTVTIGAGGAVGASGGTTSFGTYITATGGSTGTTYAGGAGGTATGTNVYILGGQGGSPNLNFPWGGFPTPGHPGANNLQASAQGGGLGGGRFGVNANGVFGGGGGGSAAGAQGCVIIEEIYGFV
jgi:hypothetical protein